MCVCDALTDHPSHSPCDGEDHLSDYAPSDVPSDLQGDWLSRQDRLVPVVPGPLDEEARQRRAQLQDDVLWRFKRTAQAAELPQGEEQMAKRLQKVDFVNYTLSALAEPVLHKQDAPCNQWLGRKEVEQLNKLLDMHLSSVHLHQQPCKRLQPPSRRNPKRPRLTVMFAADESMAVCQESAEQVEARPRRGSSFLWRGLTLFPPRRRASTTLWARKVAPETEPIFVEKDGVVYKTFPVDSSTFLAASLDLRRGTKLSKAFILKMKANGKELDPKFFDFKERTAGFR